MLLLVLALLCTIVDADSQDICIFDVTIYLEFIKHFFFNKILITLSYDKNSRQKMQKMSYWNWEMFGRVQFKHLFHRFWDVLIGEIVLNAFCNPLTWLFQGRMKYDITEHFRIGGGEKMNLFSHFARVPPPSSNFARKETGMCQRFWEFSE